MLLGSTGFVLILEILLSTGLRIEGVDSEMGYLEAIAFSPGLLRVILSLMTVKFTGVCN